MINLIHRNLVTEGYYPWHFTYFHGALEKHVYEQTKEHCCDLVASNVELSTLNPGVYEGLCYGKKVYIYLWHRLSNQSVSGLVVDKEDIDYILDAEEKYKKKTPLI
jgi:hypothetical protein